MRYIIIVAFYILLFTFGSIFKARAAGTDDLLHPVAHGAGSYALVHLGTVGCKRLTGMGTMPCSLMAGVATAGIGAAVEASQDQSKGNWKKGIAYDLLGIGLSVTVISVEF